MSKNRGMNIFGNRVSGSVTISGSGSGSGSGDSALRCTCGNTGNWQDMTMDGGGVSATCVCGATATT